MAKKRSLLLLRGLGRESRHWGKFIKFLEQENFLKEILCCDLAGSGKFYKEKGFKTISEIQEHLFEHYYDDFKKASPLCILGLSLGGMVAMEALSKEDDLFSECIFINSSTGKLSPFYKRLKISALPKFLKVAGSKNLKEKEKKILDFSSKVHKNDKELLYRYMHIAKTAPMKTPALLMQLEAAMRFQGPNKEIKTRGLVLSSANDELVSPECSKKIAEHLSMKHVQHPSAGHDLSLDDPEWVTIQIKNFLEDAED